MKTKSSCFWALRIAGGLAIALATLSLQGCGLISVSRAALIDKERIEKEDGGPAFGRKLQTKEVKQCPDGSEDLNVCLRDLVLLRLPPARENAGYPVPAAIQRLEGFARSSDLAPTLLPMAHLANVVYHRHQKDEAARNKPETACDEGESHPMGPRVTRLPATVGPELADDLHGGWRRWGRANEACTADREGGLFYDTYVHLSGDPRSTEDPVQFAIVFRGTENYLSQRFHDWTDNFLSALGHSPRQYTLAIDRLKTTMGAIEAWRKELGVGAVKIYAVGHSLGGGLAQQAGYLYRQIDAVYAFNTSPVTNWTQLMLWDDGSPHVKNRDPVIFRIEQQGEFLDYVRFVTTKFNLAHFNRVDVQFNLGKYGPVGGHSIAKLSCHLAARVADYKSSLRGDPVNYTASQARALLTLSTIKDFGCDRETLEGICTASPYLPSAVQACARIPSL